MPLKTFASSDLIENPIALREFREAFLDAGGIVVTGIVPQERIDVLRESAEAFSAERRDGEMQYSPFIHIQREREEYANLVRDRNLVQYVELLLGSPAELIQAMLYFKPPGYLGFNKHQDNFFCEVDPPESMIVAWVAVDDADEENGCLAVYPGTHHEPILPVRQIDDPGTGRQSSNFNERYQESLVPDRYMPELMKVPAGGVAFMHSHLVHESGRNSSENRFRRAVAIDYIRMGAPFRPGNSAKRYRFSLYD